MRGWWWQSSQGGHQEPSRLCKERSKVCLSIGGCVASASSIRFGFKWCFAVLSNARSLLKDDREELVTVSKALLVSFQSFPKDFTDAFFYQIERGTYLVRQQAFLFLDCHLLPLKAPAMKQKMLNRFLQVIFVKSWAPYLIHTCFLVCLVAGDCFVFWTRARCCHLSCILFSNVWKYIIQHSAGSLV